MFLCILDLEGNDGNVQTDVISMFSVINVPPMERDWKMGTDPYFTEVPTTSIITCFHEMVNIMDLPKILFKSHFLELLVIPLSSKSQEHFEFCFKKLFPPAFPVLFSESSRKKKHRIHGTNGIFAYMNS